MDIRGVGGVDGLRSRGGRGVVRVAGEVAIAASSAGAVGGSTWGVVRLSAGGWAALERQWPKGGDEGRVVSRAGGICRSAGHPDGEAFRQMGHPSAMPLGVGARHRATGSAAAGDSAQASRRPPAMGSAWVGAAGNRAPAAAIEPLVASRVRKARRRLAAVAPRSASFLGGRTSSRSAQGGGGR